MISLSYHQRQILQIQLRQQIIGLMQWRENGRFWHYKNSAQCENIISCLSLGFILNMEQEETKGCSGVSIDAPDPGHGLCTISFAGVSQRANINVRCCCG